VMKYLASKGITKPKVALISDDNAAGNNSVKNATSSFKGAGWRVVYAKAPIPAPPAVVGDYSPFTQALLESKPDAIYLLASLTDTIQLSQGLLAAGYDGVIGHPYYAGVLAKPLAGTYALVGSAAPETASRNPQVQKIADAVDAYKPGARLSGVMMNGYFAADFFIDAVKKVGTKNLTSAAVQKAAAAMTYGLPKTIGPTPYPKSFQALGPTCLSMVKSDGTTWTVTEPYTCTTERFPVKNSS
jgi:ABC-type branched-subunit amino acid transport system substrate-binding protein